MAAMVLRTTLTAVLVGIMTPTWGMEWKPGPVPVPFAVPEEVVAYQPSPQNRSCYTSPVFLDCLREISAWKCGIRRPEPAPSSRNQWHWVCHDTDGEERYVGTRSPWDADICRHLCGKDDLVRAPGHEASVAASSCEKYEPRPEDVPMPRCRAKDMRAMHGRKGLAMDTDYSIRRLGDTELGTAWNPKPGSIPVPIPFPFSFPTAGPNQVPQRPLAAAGSTTTSDKGPDSV